MGIYKPQGTPNRAGWDVDKYDGWPMALIIREFVLDKDLSDMYTRTQLRRALLVSQEYNAINKGLRFNV
jgi:hypothetical protein